MYIKILKTCAFMYVTSGNRTWYFFHYFSFVLSSAFPPLMTVNALRRLQVAVCVLMASVHCVNL